MSDETLALPGDALREGVVDALRSALGADLHARIGETDVAPGAHRDRLKNAVDRAIALARKVASDGDSEAEARRATSVLYHVATAVTLAWEAQQTYERRGDARRLLFSRLVLDHRLSAPDPFDLQSGAREAAFADALLSDAPVSQTRAAELLA